MAGDPTRLYEHFAPPERLTLVLEAMARDDAKEVNRLKDACPRKTYTQRDIEFDDRLTMAFDIMAVVCIDLRAMWAKLDVLHWIIGNTQQIATALNITDALAFVDGERCGEGLSQCDFFARTLPSPEAEVNGDDADGDADEEAIVDDDEEDDDNDVFEPSKLQIDRGRRLDSVQKRAEYFTACGMVALLASINDIAQDLVNTWAAFDRFCTTRIGITAEMMLRAWEFPVAGEFEEMLNRYAHVKADPAKVDEYTGYICKHWDQRFNSPDSEYLTYGDDGDGE